MMGRVRKGKKCGTAEKSVTYNVIFGEINIFKTLCSENKWRDYLTANNQTVVRCPIVILQDFVGFHQEMSLFHIMMTTSDSK